MCNWEIKKMSQVIGSQVSKRHMKLGDFIQELEIEGDF